MTHGDLEAALRQLFEWDIDLIPAGEFRNPYFRQSVEDIVNSDDLIRSVPQALTRIGESLNRLSRRDPATAERITHYHGYISQRNILVHQYVDTNWDKVWYTVTVEAPLLIEEVDALIAELDPQERRD